MNVDDLVRIRIEDAARKIEAARRRREGQRAARDRGLARRHAAKLRNLAEAEAAGSGEAAVSPPDETAGRLKGNAASKEMFGWLGVRVDVSALSPTERRDVLLAARALVQPSGGSWCGPRPFPKARVLLAEPGCPAPGTIVSAGGVATVYVGHVWPLKRGEIGAVAERLRGHELVEFVAATHQAGGRARALVRAAWKAADAVDSGELPGRARLLARSVLGLSVTHTAEGESA